MADVVVDNIGFKATSSLTRISAWKWISYLAEESNATELSYRKMLHCELKWSLGC